MDYIIKPLWFTLNATWRVTRTLIGIIIFLEYPLFCLRALNKSMSGTKLTYAMACILGLRANVLGFINLFRHPSFVLLALGIVLYVSGFWFMFSAMKYEIKKIQRLLGFYF